MTKSLVSTLKRVKAIGFDLDDTLWDNRDVIQRAIARQFEYLQLALPSQSLNHIKAAYTYFVERRVTDDRLRYQDMSLLRKDALSDLCNFFKVDRTIAKTAFDIFYQERQSFTLFAEVESLLEALKDQWTLFALSNGNASLANTPIKNQFKFHWRGGLDGQAKPSGELIIRAAHKLNIRTDEILYVGDKMEIDGQAAINANCYGLIIAQQDKMECINKQTGKELIHYASDLKEFLDAVYNSKN